MRLLCKQNYIFDNMSFFNIFHKEITDWYTTIPKLCNKQSCNTEDWSNDAENAALHHNNKLHFKIFKNRK